MTLDKDLLFELTKKSKSFQIKIGEKTIPVEKTQILYSEVPVNKPTNRGGVYFSDTMAFKAKAIFSDHSISKYLSKSMLGPNSDFEKIQLITNTDDGKKLKIITNLTNYVEKKESLELYLTIIDTDLIS